MLWKHGVNPAPSINPFQRRADRPGTRPPGQGGGGSHALPASCSPAPLQTELRQLVWPLGVGQDPRAPAQRQQLPAHCPPAPQAALLLQPRTIKPVSGRRPLLLPPLHSSKQAIVTITLARFLFMPKKVCGGCVRLCVLSVFSVVCVCASVVLKHFVMDTLFTETGSIPILSWLFTSNYPSLHSVGGLI